jgi:hypothetical protein
VEVLKDLKPDEQARAIRWAEEKLGLTSQPLITNLSASATARTAAPTIASTRPAATDIASFMQSKAPGSDVQFAAAVAYYYAFEAPETARKPEITATDVRDATRLSSWTRLKKPIVTLHNALKRGYLDKGKTKGSFKLNAVGENLVAMSMGPTAGTAPTLTRTAARKK